MPFPNTTEIARIVGCSQQTVSRILRGKAHLHRAELVEKVTRIAKDHGYRPNLLTSGLLRGKTMTVGMMVPMRDDAFYARMVSGAHNHLSENGFLPLLCYGTSKVSAREQMLRLVDRRVDGFILRPMFEPVDERYLADVIAAKIPVVTVNRPPNPESGLDYVGTDDFLGGQLAARHLLDRGHVRAVYLSMDESRWNPTSPFYKRWQGFEQVFTKSGGIASKILIPAHSLEECAAGFFQASEALSHPNPPTAFFLGFDQLAWGVYKAVRACGRSTPDDVAVVGFSDQAFAAHMDPPLTTVAQNPEQIGMEAAHRLIARIEDSEARANTPYSMLLAPSLRIREST